MLNSSTNINKSFIDWYKAYIDLFEQDGNNINILTQSAPIVLPKRERPK